jgi:tetratricopeptide (TPR) repeat protein
VTRPARRDEARDRCWRWAALAALLPVALFLTPIRNLDLWWHLDAGRWMLEHGRYLDQEVRSFSLPGAHWANFSWLFQVLVALVERLGGGWGLLTLKGLTWWGIFTLLFRAIGGRGAPLAWWLALALFSWQLFPAMHLRPHLFEGLSLAASLWLLRQSPSRRWLASSAGLVLFWANVHASVVVGACALALHWLLGPRWHWPGGSALARRLPGALLLGGLVFLTPNGLGLLQVLQGHASADYMALYIREWLPTSAMPPFLFLALVATALALVLRRGLLAPGEVLLIGLFLVLAGSNKRFLFELSLLTLRPAGALLGLGLARLGARHPGFGQQGWIAGLGLLLPLVLLFPPPWTWRAVQADDYPVMSRHYPHVAWSVLRPIAEADGPLRVWNAYGWGGWLGWVSHGQLRVYIDGRTPTVFDEELMLQGQLAHQRPTMLRTLLDQWRVDAVILRHQGAIPIPPGDPEWWLVAYDADSVVWLRAALAARYGLADLGFDPFRPLLRVPHAALPQAIGRLRRLLAADRRNPLAWTHLAELLIRHGDTAETGEIEAALALAIAQEPEQARPRLRLAQWRQRRGRPADEVLASLLPWTLQTRARNLAGYEPAIARLLLEAGRPDAALQVLRPDDWQRMQELNRHADVWMIRAQAHHRRGDRARAERATRIAGWLTLDAGAAAQARYRRLLEEQASPQEQSP